MSLNESHPIRATVTIIWKRKYVRVKTKFENQLRDNCEIFPPGSRRRATLELVGVTSEFDDTCDIVGQTGRTGQFSYIIKDTFSDATHTSFDLFNNKEHILEQVKDVKKLLMKTIHESRMTNIFTKYRCCKLKTVFTINKIIFRKPNFGSSMKDSLPFLFGWLIFPLIKLISMHSKTANVLYGVNLNNNETIINNINTTISQTSSTEIIISLIVIVIIFFVVSFIKWRQSQNVVKL